jgi:hypothetical protein
METLKKIKELTETLSVDTEKFYKGNKKLGTSTSKGCQN